jgi:hypothetical protein
MSAASRRRVSEAVIGLAAATLVLGCGGEGDADRFEKTASAIQGCERDLSRKPVARSTIWVGATEAEAVICGPPDISDGRLLVVARYASSDAAAAAARRFSRRRLLCVVGNRVVESWMYPDNALDEIRAGRQARTWARLFCARVRGQSIGRWSAWKYSR